MKLFSDCNGLISPFRAGKPFRGIVRIPWFVKKLGVAVPGLALEHPVAK